MTNKEKSAHKTMCMMETDFIGCKKDGKKKEMRKLSPRILSERYKARRGRYG